MWNAELTELGVRQTQLLARSQQLRERLGQEAQAMAPALAVADRVRGGFQWLMARPLWLAAIVAVPLLLRPRRAIAWGLKMIWGWRVWRRLQALRADSDR
jgi:hypothetical protein